MIPIKTKAEIAVMQEGGRVLAQIMEKLKSEVVEGASCLELDRAACALVFDSGATPAFKGYIDPHSKNKEPFPSALCVSINDVVVHGVPSDYILKSGDVVSLDLGIKYKGFYSDMAITEFVRGQMVQGQTLHHLVQGLPLYQTEDMAENMRLIRVAKKALKFGISKCHIGNTFGDIGNTIQRFVESQGFNVVRDLAGHGIGKALHEDPQISNYGKRHKGEKIEEGMCFCLEPMITRGNWKLTKTPDGFGYKTKDGSVACHFEHTISIVNGLPLVLTKL